MLIFSNIFARFSKSALSVHTIFWGLSAMLDTLWVKIFCYFRLYHWWKINSNTLIKDPCHFLTFNWQITINCYLEECSGKKEKNKDEKVRWTFVSYRHGEILLRNLLHIFMWLGNCLRYFSKNYNKSTSTTCIVSP